MPVIRFTKNWNNKLNCEYFTTIRLSTKKTSEYYFSNLSETFKVLLKGKEYCEAKLLSMREENLTRLLKEGLSYTDAGLKEVEFYQLMKKFYSRKSEWQDYNTYCLVLFFKRIK